MILLVTGLLPLMVELCLGSSQPSNLVLDKPVQYGSIKEGVKESWGNDGHINKNCFVSKDNGEKYWEVGLPYLSLISHIEIYSENEPNELRLITVSKPQKETKTVLAGKSCVDGCKIPINKELIKIRIEKLGPSALNLCEVAAYGKVNKVQENSVPSGGASTDASGTTADGKKRANSIEMCMFTHIFIISLMILITRCM
uniref:Spermatid elongation defective 1 n=1 Tax=Schmidtea mediterranea TaxID=79327 RepID=E2FB13_SCHMD|nr:spermatid elongation defective 1 [Schmidtea mediterranea]